MIRGDCYEEFGPYSLSREPSPCPDCSKPEEQDASKPEPEPTSGELMDMVTWRNSGEWKEDAPDEVEFMDWEDAKVMLRDADGKPTEVKLYGSAIIIRTMRRASKSYEDMMDRWRSHARRRICDCCPKRKEQDCGSTPEACIAATVGVPPIQEP